jgi:hypothetical protein
MIAVSQQTEKQVARSATEALFSPDHHAFPRVPLRLERL